MAVSSRRLPKKISSTAEPGGATGNLKINKGIGYPSEEKWRERPCRPTIVSS